MVDDPRLLIAACATVGACCLTMGVSRWRRRRLMWVRIRSLAVDRADARPLRLASTGAPRELAGRLGARLSARLPGEVGSLAARVDRAGLSGAGIPAAELLGWKVVLVVFGALVGVAGLARYGSIGVVILAFGVLIGWFGIDLMLERYQAQRRRAIMRDLPTVMDLLVLSLEAGMSLDRALRTVVREYRSVLSDEIRRVLGDTDLGIPRGEAFERMATRVGLEDLHSLSRALIQGEELGVSLVGVMQTQSREVRLSRRRTAETEALRAPIKMLFPLVVFILPTLFMLLLGPVGLRAAGVVSGALP